ncbi:phosphatase 1 regulatory subunit pprA [Spatholobus suberectus]|nr:phosphatase 1 regulatory subunit pprA [Spatholobus suberectus]
MFWFSCFHAHVQSKRPKNTAEPYVEAITRKAAQDGAQNEVSKDLSIPSSFEFQVSSGPANDGLEYLLRDPTPSDVDAQEILDTPLSGELACDSSDHVVGVTIGMEGAKSYISSLGASAIESQLSNHGLHEDVVPLISTFENPKFLNLSGNAIGFEDNSRCASSTTSLLEFVKKQYLHHRGIAYAYTALCPRPQLQSHKKNQTWPCILFIFGGADLAGNKINEVDGLHRLSKLSILDIHFNEISSAKCLGQLVANYNSLQAISLDGNPTQNNPMKISTFRDAADQSVQLGVNSTQFNCTLRLDHKTTRKGNRGVVDAKKSSKLSKGKSDNTVLLPPSEAKCPHKKETMLEKNLHFDFWSNVLNLTLGFSICKGGRLAVRSRILGDTSVGPIANSMDNNNGPERMASIFLLMTLKIETAWI